MMIMHDRPNAPPASDTSATASTSATSPGGGESSRRRTRGWPVIAHSPELGGDVVRIRAGPDENEGGGEDAAGFLTAVGVPTFAVVVDSTSGRTSSSLSVVVGEERRPPPRRMGLEGVLRNPNAFVLENALPVEVCERLIRTCETELGFGSYDAGKNNHGAMQVVVSENVADVIFGIVGPHVDLEGIVSADGELRRRADGNDEDDDDDDDDDRAEDGGSRRCHYAPRGINRRFRVYRYAPDGDERFAPHVDAGFPPGGSSLDDDDDVDVEDDDRGGASSSSATTPCLHWDASHQYRSSSSGSSSEVVSRLTVLIYLNDDFNGGHTKFYEPEIERQRRWGDDGGDDGGGVVIASVRPRAGSMLVFPQAVTEEAVERAREIWPLHEGSPVASSGSGRPKYVIRTDVLFETITTNGYDDDDTPEDEKALFVHDDAVRDAFLNASPMFSNRFLHHVWPLYNPHMGVENVGPMLYSFVRFAKVRSVVEVGAGYTTLFLLQALRDNDVEMKRLSRLDGEGRLRLLDYPFSTPGLGGWASSSDSHPPHANDDPTTATSPPPSSSSLLCIDNCEHQRETASSAVGVARTLGLESYLQFLRGDAFDALDTHFSNAETVDMLWCDFGVGSRMTEYASGVWRYIRPGGFLVCHSTLTNARTRAWLEGVRRHAGAEVTGIPAGEYAELSLLEPHKRFQNSVTILQKRVGEGGARFEEPIYSEYA